MKKILVTGGTVFVSRYIAEHYVAQGHEVYVLNRNTKEQSKGVKLIEADRYNLGETLRVYNFDLVVDTGYNAKAVEMLLDAIGGYKDYVFISSSAVYSEDLPRPFKEDAEVTGNMTWGKYATDKIEAEELLLKREQNAYILRPPYIYGPMNNVYRESFIFDCAMNGRKFYMPPNDEMKIQFSYVGDICRFIDVILEKRPLQHIFNVGNTELVSVKDWVQMCYDAVGTSLESVNVQSGDDQLYYFCFHDYEFSLDVTAQCQLLQDLMPVSEGLKASFAWYKDNTDKVSKRNYIKYIDEKMK